MNAKPPLPRQRVHNDATGAVTKFAATGLAAVVVLGSVGVVVSRGIGTDEAVRQAEQVTRLAGNGIVEPALTDELIAGDPVARARVDLVVRERVLREPFVRVKLWTAGGRIVYSDEPRLIGSVYIHDEEEQEILRSGGVEAKVSDLSGPENRFERSEGELLEVYVPVRTPGGRPLLFEAYLRQSSVTASARRLFLAFAPALVASLLVLWLIQVPLAWSLSRRLRRGQVEREGLLRRAIEASDIERRRVAAELHDGPVQGLAGVAYALAAAERPTGDGGNGARAPILGEAGRELRRIIRELRSMLVDIYPPSLHRQGLGAALSDLTAGMAARGAEVDVDVPADAELAPEVEALLFRGAQEALRNAAAHADASNVRVRLGVTGERAILSIEDDGRGFSRADVLERPAEGHFGLRLLGDLVGDAGGTLEVDSAPGHGTNVRIEVPR